MGKIKEKQKMGLPDGPVGKSTCRPRTHMVAEESRFVSKMPSDFTCMPKPLKTDVN